ncbi:MAG TPA: DUF4446 family protein [Candidatus Paceibacterota bacterium]|nr:DUF4446 family protein [Candidatus Paceibacterota bacterium]
MASATIPLLFIIAGVLAVATVWLTVSHFRLRRKLTAFMQGNNAASLEESLKHITDRNVIVEKTLSAHKEALEHLNGRLAKSVRGLSLVRYNAFPDTGGLQSFASGLLDEHGNGFILSVVTSRSHVGIYAKPVTAYKPAVELADEEARALSEAKEHQTI